MWENTQDYISNKEYRKRVQPNWIQYCRSKLDKTWYEYSGQRREFEIEKLYREGRIEGYLHLMDFEEFKRKLTKGKYGFYNDRDWRRNRLRDHIKYNVHGKKNPVDYSEKKILTKDQIAKREWRKKVKDPRDQKRWCSRTTAFKAANKRTHRAYENYCINTGQFDRLHDRTWKQMEDWWSYD